MVHKTVHRKLRFDQKQPILNVGELMWNIFLFLIRDSYETEGIYESTYHP
jgi:hypothetical protein